MLNFHEINFTSRKRITYKLNNFQKSSLHESQHKIMKEKKHLFHN